MGSDRRPSHHLFYASEQQKMRAYKKNLALEAENDFIQGEKFQAYRRGEAIDLATTRKLAKLYKDVLSQVGLKNATEKSTQLVDSMFGDNDPSDATLIARPRDIASSKFSKSTITRRVSNNSLAPEVLEGSPRLGTRSEEKAQAVPIEVDIPMAQAIPLPEKEWSPWLAALNKMSDDQQKSEIQKELPKFMTEWQVKPPDYQKIKAFNDRLNKLGLASIDVKTAPRKTVKPKNIPERSPSTNLMGETVPGSGMRKVQKKRSSKMVGKGCNKLM